MRFLITTLLLAAIVLPSLASAQQPVPPPPPTQESSSTSKHNSKIPPFLILGTVFNEHALAFPGVEVKIRRKGEKKFRYDTYTNSRGEFAIRVPQGSDYELVVRVKGFAEQTRTIDAKTSGNVESMVFRMQPAAGDKG